MTTPRVSLCGRIALVTGAGGALGRQIALNLARLGATVVLAVRDEARARALTASIARATGNANVYPLALDLASLRSVRRAAREFIARFGQLHVLVNSGGIDSRDHLGPFLLANLLLDTMKKSGGARIIGIAMPSTLAGRGAAREVANAVGAKMPAGASGDAAAAGPGVGVG